MLSHLLFWHYKSVRTVARLTVVAFCGSALAQAATVDIHPGEDIPSVVQASPAGTTFSIYPGRYRLTEPVVPKNGDVFIGQTACAPPTTSCPAILSGARLLTSFEHNQSYYYVTGQTQQGFVSQPSTICATGWEGCIYPEDLYFDNVPLQHVTSLAEVGPGKWFFDYSSQTIYFYDNPTGHTVETSVTDTAFTPGPANNVTIKGLTVEKFASPIMTGAIGGAGTGFGSPNEGANWIIENNEIRLSHADGVRINFGWQVLNNYIHNNGALGMGGAIGGGNPDGSGTLPSNVLIQGNELAYNNYAQVKEGMGAGGAKFTATRSLIIRDNYVHNNDGDGLHTDFGNYDTLFDNNTVADNTQEGLFHEISYTAIVRNNKLLRNGYIFPNETFWLYGANLLSATSQGVEAYCNTVEVSGAGGNGIDILTQTRTGYTVVSENNYFHHNTVFFEGNSGITGGARGETTITNFFSSNKFDYNAYHLPGLTRHAFAWNDKYNTFATFQADGQDTHGTADTKNTSSAPTIVITSPADGSTVSGTVDVKGTAQDSASIEKVEFYVDWNLQSNTTADSFTFTLDTSGLSAGAHTVAAMAYSDPGISSCYAVTLNVPHQRKWDSLRPENKLHLVK